MNRLKTGIDGGMPLEQDDFAWIHSCNMEALQGLVNALCPEDLYEGFILQGCSVVDAGSDYEIAEGFIAWNGEIFYVPAHSLTKATGTYYWGIEITYDASGNETFEDLDANDTYEQRRMKLMQSSTPPDPYLEMDISDVIVILKERLGYDHMVTGWSAYASPTIAALGSGSLTVSDKEIRYKIRGKSLIMSIFLEISVSADVSVISISVPESKSITNNTHSSGCGEGYNAGDVSTKLEYSCRIHATYYSSASRVLLKRTASEVFGIGSHYIYGQIEFEID